MHLPPSLSAPCARILPPPSLPLVHASSPLPLRPLCTHLPPSLSPATMGSSQQLTRSSVLSHSATSLSLPLRPFCSRFPSSQQSPSVSPHCPHFPPLTQQPRRSSLPAVDALVRSITFCPVKQIYFPLSHLSTSLPSPLPAPPNGLLPSLSAPSALISPHPLSTVMTGSSLQSTPSSAQSPSALHDGFFPAVDALIRSITFCPVKQIYFPLSLHLQNGSFPNRSPLDCPSSSSFKGRRDGQQEEGQRKGKNGQGNGQKEGLENGQEEGQKEERKEEGACFGDVDQNGRYRDPHFVALKVHAVGLVIQ
ncbi:unnamed protein product [Closterium sp. NIES-65]|nr:unnamed protein product [Closterium sp. NIES-65]